MQRLLWLVGSILCGSLVAAAGLRFEMTPAEVEAAMGRPSSKLSRGDVQVWLYPGGGKVEFHQGHATSISNLPMDDGSTPAGEPPVEPAAAASAPVPAAAAATGPTAAPPPDPAIPAALGNLAPVDPSIDEVVDQTATDIAWMEHGPELHEPSWGERLVMLALEAAVGMVLTMVVLKLAFKWSDIHADWSQMVLPAFADMITRTSVTVVALLVWHTPEVFHLDHALSYLALLFTMMKTTHASSLKRAVAVAGAAKFATVVMWSMLSLVLLQLLYG